MFISPDLTRQVKERERCRGKFRSESGERPGQAQSISKELEIASMREERLFPQRVSAGLLVFPLLQILLGSKAP